MPSYDYQCQDCKHAFEKNVKIADRENCTKEACPECGKKKVERVYGSPGVGDSTRLATSKPSDGWKEVLSKVKEKHKYTHKIPDRW